jgi:hypothetical protein
MLQFTIDKNRDPDRAKLRSVLEAQLACERMRAARSLIAHLLAVTGVVLWLSAMWPDLLSPQVRLFSLMVFGVALFLLLRVLIEEFAWRVKLKRCLKDNDGVKLERAHGSN